MSFPDYTIPGGADHGRLQDSLAALGIAGLVGLTVSGDIVIVHYSQTPSAPDIVLIDNVVAGHVPTSDLDRAKQAKNEQINQRTGALMEAGFPCSGKQFPLSMTAQIKLAAMYQIRTALAYPLKLNTVDDTDTTELADVAALDAFYAAAMAALRGCLDSGTALKDLVRAAADVAAVDAIEDNR